MVALAQKIEEGLVRIAIRHVNSASGLCLYEPKAPNLLEGVTLKSDKKTMKNKN